jgi:expansin
VGALSGAGGSLGEVGGAGGMVTGGAGGMIAQGGMVTDPCAGVTCGADQTCSNGTCQCMTGMLCGTTCVDVEGDINHCGGCDKPCDATGSCVSGACVVPNCTQDTQTRNGRITYYSLATPMVACHYPTSSLPQHYGAMNEFDWNNAGVCGACVEITNGGSKLVVQIVDQCPYVGNEQWCKEGSHHIDLNPAAYQALGANNNPAVTWKYVPCNVSNNLKYYFDEASQKYYLAVTPMNHKNPMAKMEVKKPDGKWAAMERSTYNMFVLDGGTGTEENTFTFRLTDIYNHVVTDTVTMSAGQTVNGNVQFAACP